MTDSLVLTSLNSADRTPELPRVMPALPEGLKFGVGGCVGLRAFAGLGSMGQRWLMLDLGTAAAQWTDMPPFPGVPREQACAVTVGADIWVLGGLAAASDGMPGHVLDDIYRFDAATLSWSQVDSRVPGGLLGASGALLPDGRLYFFGGVNKYVMDGFLREAARTADSDARQRLLRAYLEQAPENYHFAADVRCYDPALNRWSALPAPDFLPVVGAALACEEGLVTLIGGEIKPGLRADRVQQVRFDKPAALDWLAPSSLPVPGGQAVQEGLAGAFCGFSHGVLLCAGGTHFPGARARFAAGHHFAHEGLRKSWRREIYARTDEGWRQVGRLPAGRAHGISLELGGRLWLLGGEGEDGQALADLLLLDEDLPPLVSGGLAPAQACTEKLQCRTDQTSAD